MARTGNGLGMGTTSALVERHSSHIDQHYLLGADHTRYICV